MYGSPINNFVQLRLLQSRLSEATGMQLEQTTYVAVLINILFFMFAASFLILKAR